MKLGHGIASIMLATLAAAACSNGGVTAPGTPAPSGAAPNGSPAVISDPPVTLRLAVADPPGRPSDTAVRHFVGSVAGLSRGSITIIATFDAGDQTALGFEHGVADLVVRGDADLGLAASRAWDLVGTTSLQAFQAPFLIDNDALAVAVARGETSQRALDAMTGVVGLTLWPEDLRHVFGFPQCGKDFRSVSDLAGATILIQPSAVSRDLFAVFGAIEYAGKDRRADAATCALQGQEAGFAQTAAIADHSAVAVGNVTLFPKYQVLAANNAAFDLLTPAQQQILRDAAIATQAHAIERRPTDATLALEWCAQGGSVILATPEQQAEFVAAAAGLQARLEADPLTGQLISEIRALKVAAPATGDSVAAPCDGTALTPAPTGASTAAGILWERRLRAERLEPFAIEPG